MPFWVIQCQIYTDQNKDRTYSIAEHPSHWAMKAADINWGFYRDDSGSEMENSIGLTVRVEIKVTIAPEKKKRNSNNTKDDVIFEI